MLGSGVLLLAPRSAVATSTTGECTCDGASPDCQAGQQVSSGTFICDGSGVGYVCVMGNWVECYNDVLDTFCENGDLDGSWCQYYQLEQ